MAVFDAAERERMKNEIIAFTKKNEHIMALVAVGSGAYGYVDELSDLDFVVATDGVEHTPAVMAYVADQIRRLANVAYFKQVDQRGLQVYFTDRSLEIDVGYGPYTSAAAFQKHWRVLFDKTGTVDEKMRLSWEGVSAAPDAYGAKAFACADMAWHYLTHAAVAIRRGRYWRAYAEIGLARDLYTGLLCCRHGLDAGRGKDVDQLPEDELAALRGTLPADLSRSALLQSLDALTDAIYAELEAYGSVDIAVGGAQVREVVDYCRALPPAREPHGIGGDSL